MAITWSLPLPEEIPFVEGAAVTVCEFLLERPVRHLVAAAVGTVSAWAMMRAVWTSLAVVAARIVLSAVRSIVFITSAAAMNIRIKSHHHSEIAGSYL
jgi:hypothetical protein